MLEDRIVGHYESVKPVFKVQTGRCYCGFNTVSMILNSLQKDLNVSEQ